MNTPIQNLQKSIAHLETTGKTGRLLDDLKKQLEDWQTSGTKSTQELYFSGRPSNSSAPTEKTHPMQPAADLYEERMRALLSDPDEKGTSK